MKKKRLLALGLAGLMTMGLMTGCGSKEDKEADGNGDGPVTVTWCVFGDKKEDLDKVIDDLNEKLVEKINVKLDLEVIPQGEFNDKMKLKSTAGEDYDLTFTSNWLNQFSENMSREAFLPLDDLYAEYGQDIAASIPDWLIDVGMVDGKLYAIPNQQIEARQLGVAIQKEYADKYGFNLTSLKDVRDLEPFLEQIAQNEPDKFPIDLRVTPVLEKDYEDIVKVTAPAGNMADAVVLKKGDESCQVLPVTDVMADELRLENDWYQRGFIRQDIATVMDNTADVKANRYVCTLSSYKPGWDGEMTTRQGVEYITVPIEGIYIKSVSGAETMTAININSKHPEEAMKLLNLVYSDKDIFNELVFGIEGEHYNKTGENSVEVIDSAKYDFSGYAWMLGNQFNAYYLPGQEDGIWEQTDQMNREAELSPLRGFVFDPSNVQSEIAQVGSVAKEYANGQYTTTDIEGYIKEKSEKMEQAGLQTIVDECQKQIDEWMAEQK